MSLQGDSLFEEDYWDLCEQIVPHRLDMGWCPKFLQDFFGVFGIDASNRSREP